jgi:hypothetical protein
MRSAPNWLPYILSCKCIVTINYMYQNLEANKFMLLCHGSYRTIICCARMTMNNGNDNLNYSPLNPKFVWRLIFFWINVLPLNYNCSHHTRDHARRSSVVGYPGLWKSPSFRSPGQPDYCSAVWGNCGNGLSDSLQILQNRAV